MRTGSGSEINNHASEIVRPAESTHGIGLRNLIRTPGQLEETVGHLGREETRANTVYCDVSWTELDGEIPAKVNHGGFAGTVACFFESNC